MTDVDARSVGGEVGARIGGGTVGARSVGGKVGARLAEPQAQLWTPAQLGSDLALWLDAQDESTLTKSDVDSDGTDEASAWSGVEGGGTVERSQEAGRPEYEPNGIGGNASLRWDGTDDYLEGALQSGGDDILLFALTERNSTRAEEGYIDLNDGNSTNSGCLLFVGGGTIKARVEASNRLTSDTGVSEGGIHLLTLRYTTDGLFARVDGARKGVVAYDGPMQTTQEVRIGALKGFSLKFDTEGLSGEYVHAQGSVTEKDAEKIEGSAAHRFGVTDLLDSNHPYKDSPPTA